MSDCSVKTTQTSMKGTGLNRSCESPAGEDMNSFRGNKVLGFIVTFLRMAVASIAYYVFFDWFYCIVVKKETFVFIKQRMW